MKLKELRKSKNITQAEIARKMHIGQSAYSMIECGQRKLTIENAKLLGNILEIDWWQLFESESLQDQ